MHCTSQALLRGAFGTALHRTSTLPPPFLIPAVSILPQTTSFSSTSTSLAKRKARKDANPSRGVSALRHSGLKKQKLPSVDLSKLPQPVLDPQRRSKVIVDEDHGLWQFFNAHRDSLLTPLELDAHGRAWTVRELRNKDWDDLWSLWWVCVKERNRIETFNAERARLANRGGGMYGEFEAEKRSSEIKLTQRAIKHVLTERWYAWEDARFAAMDDPEVNLYADPEQGEPAFLAKQESDEATLVTPEESISEAVKEPAWPPPEEGIRPYSSARV